VARDGGRPFPRLLVAQFTSPLILVLIAAAVVSRYAGEPVEAAVIVAIVLVNAALGLVQEYRAERSLRALRRFVTHRATVRRDGALVDVPAADLVPGDVVSLEIGDVVPADLRLLVLDDLSCDEAILTGESLPVAKRVEPVPAAAAPHERVDVAFMGTAVTGGYGAGVVIATGSRTLFGRSAAALAPPPHETDFQRGIRRFSDVLLVVILAMTAFMVAANALLGKGTFDSLLFALALAVGITPEALPVIVTIALSNGALRMAREKVVTRRLIAVEDLGNVDTLCCDKTGTLTEGAVSLRDYLSVEGERDQAVLRLGLLSASLAGTRAANAIGALDRAVWESPAAQPLHAAVERDQVIDRNEFDFRRRRMSVVVRSGGRHLLVVKGAPEAVLAACTGAATGDATRPLTADLAARLLRRVTAFEEQGFRVIALAEKAVAGAPTDASDERDLVARGFLLFLDPPKRGVDAALRELRGLGVDLKVMSGDSAAVTRRICRDVGLPVVEDRVITGGEVDALDAGTLADTVRRYNVFARVTPEQKHQLVAALGAAGHVVGFLGDGVNDVPALEAADVGIRFLLPGTAHHRHPSRPFPLGRDRQAPLRPVTDRT
jgi:Mg2+-importing ATPase